MTGVKYRWLGLGVSRASRKSPAGGASEGQAYLFRGDDGAVLYVGKAKSLRQRVRSYFQKTGDMRLGSAQLVERIHDIETIVAGTEAQALHLEQSLVKRHRPPFNIRLPATTSRSCASPSPSRTSTRA